MEHIKLLIGWDEREAVGSHVFLQSVVDRCSLPVDVTILTPKLLKSLGVGTDGTNAFSKARFLAPHIYGHSGHCIFLDAADMLVVDDLADLWAQRDYRAAVQVVKHDYSTKNPKKYIGTDLEAKNEDYPRKNWSSVILWHNSYFGHKQLTPAYVEQTSGKDLHRFSWVPDDRIGELDKSWNYIIGEDNQAKAVKIAHYSLGIPGFNYYENVEYSDKWKQTWMDMNKGLQYQITLNMDKR